MFIKMQWFNTKIALFGNRWASIHLQYFKLNERGLQYVFNDW